MGPNFRSDRDAALGGPAAVGPRARRPSILEAGQPPSEYLAAQQAVAETTQQQQLQLQLQQPLVGGAPPNNTTRARARTNSSVLVNGNGVGVGGADGAANNVTDDPAELQNARAVEVLDRVNQKLTGRDFKTHEELEVVAQVNKLIIEATKLENLCQHYIGWCSFW